MKLREPKNQRALSHLAAVTLARHAEQAATSPNQAVLAACDLFLVGAVREAAAHDGFPALSDPDRGRPDRGLSAPYSQNPGAQDTVGTTDLPESHYAHDYGHNHGDPEC